MDSLATTLLMALLLSDAASHLCLKAASRRGARFSGMVYWLTLLSRPVLWVGIAIALADFFVWVAFLSRVPLGQGVMAGSITIVGVMLGVWLCFGEHITRPRMAAITCIALGVVLVGWGQA